MNLKTLHDIPDIKGKRFFVRVDFNVPMDDQGNIRDDKRIRHALPTIHHLLDNGAARVILATHVGRPKQNEERLKTDKIAEKLSELLGEPVKKIDGWEVGNNSQEKVVLLENLRFHSGEKNKNETERDAFGELLAQSADIYVNEAFSNSHRSHASMTSVPKFLPAYAGLGVEKEVKAISEAISNPQKPLIAVIGGLKADKLTAMNQLLDIADKILVGGALAYNLRKMQGYSVGASKVDNEGMEEMKPLVEKIIQSDKILLPEDAMLGDRFGKDCQVKEVPVDQIEDGWMALDIGPKTIETYVTEIRKAKTILWFGPIGVFEIPPFSNGTRSIGKAIAESEALSIVGGGDSASAVKKLELVEKISLVSTGGGASLKMIEGKELIALKPLKN